MAFNLSPRDISLCVRVGLSAFTLGDARISLRVRKGFCVLKVLETRVTLGERGFRLATVCVRSVFCSIFCLLVYVPSATICCCWFVLLECGSVFT